MAACGRILPTLLMELALRRVEKRRRFYPRTRQADKRHRCYSAAGWPWRDEWLYWRHSRELSYYRRRLRRGRFGQAALADKYVIYELKGLVKGALTLRAKIGVQQVASRCVWNRAMLRYALPSHTACCNVAETLLSDQA